jgi:hypothetical protein
MMIRPIALAVLLLGIAVPPLAAQQTPASPAAPPTAPPPAAAPANPPPRSVAPRAFASPEEGFSAFAAAVRAHDERRLLTVLGSAGRRLIRSGDAVADRLERERFTGLYDAEHRIARPAADRAVLEIGPEQWSLPLPMLQRGGRWRFDAAAGARELVDRRIGRNELDAIGTLRAIVEAQEEYAAGPGRQGALRVYAQRFFSTPGQRDGLYWVSAEDEPESPLGPFLAAASEQPSGNRPGDRPQPFRGYLYRMLTAQGPAAPGGAIDFVAGGRMIGGFAVIAWPARHGSTGWKTFMVSHHGPVWEADLGPDTARAARAITAFDPSSPPWSRLVE